MPIPEHINPDDVDLTDDQLWEAFSGHDSPQFLPEMTVGLRRVAKAQGARTALYLGMYYAQEARGTADQSILQRTVGDVIVRSIGQWYVSEFDADGFRKRIDAHLLSNLIAEQLVKQYDLCPQSEDGKHQVTDGSCDLCGDKNRG